jgi:hypothetical protein
VRRRYLTTKDADIGAAAAVALENNELPANAELSWQAVNLYNKAGAATWPITMVTYMYVRKDLTSLGESGTLLKAFVEYVLSTEGQKLLLDFQFVKLPQTVLDMNRIAQDSLITAASASEWTFESATMKFTGMGDHVISSKRSTYADYERAVIMGQVEDLQVCLPCDSTRGECVPSPPEAWTLTWKRDARSDSRVSLPSLLGR